METYKKLPKQCQGLPIGKVFKIKDSRWGTVDCLITHGKPPAYKEEVFFVSKCHYADHGLHRCKINSWGCNIHYRPRQHSPFGIED